MTTLREAAQQALEALEKVNWSAAQDWHEAFDDEISALRAALAQQAEPDHETRAELAEQQVVQLAEERDHYRNLRQKAQQAEPVRVPRGIRMERVDKSTSPHWWSESARIKMPSPELYAAGDTVLCWVNEGDMLMARQAEPWERRVALAEQLQMQQAEPHRDLRVALQAPGCERLREWVEIGPVQRAALETFVAALAQQGEPVEPVAWLYTGIKQDGTEHGPHLVWKPEYMDAMSASKGAKATPLYTAPPQRKED